MKRQADDAVQRFLAEDAEDFRRRYPDVRRPAGRVLVARHAGRCADCGKGFAAGTSVRWEPGATRHLDCSAAARTMQLAIAGVLDAVEGARRG